MENNEALNHIKSLANTFRALKRAEEILQAVANAEQKVHDITAGLPDLEKRRDELRDEVKDLIDKKDAASIAHMQWIRDSEEKIRARLNEAKEKLAAANKEIAEEARAKFDRTMATYQPKIDSAESRFASLVEETHDLEERKNVLVGEVSELEATRDKLREQLRALVA